jgi:hypothetical protein
MKIDCYVFVNKIDNTKLRTVVDAANGSTEGPPFVRFELIGNPKNCHIGKKYLVTIDDEEH